MFVEPSRGPEGTFAEGDAARRCQAPQVKLSYRTILVPAEPDTGAVPAEPDTGDLPAEPDTGAVPGEPDTGAVPGEPDTYELAAYAGRLVSSVPMSSVTDCMPLSRR
jgi:hypothetical protein